MKHVAHPVNEVSASAFHLAFVLAYVLAAGFHLLCSINHWRDR